MRKSIIFGVVVICLFLLTACGTPSYDVDDSEMETVIHADDGDQEVTIKTNVDVDNEDDWCPEGGVWEMTASTDEGDTSAEWIIDKLETSGEYAGYCHVIMTAEGPEGDAKIEYWFDETGESGFMKMDINGQSFTQEWSA